MSRAPLALPVLLLAFLVVACNTSIPPSFLDAAIHEPGKAIVFGSAYVEVEGDAQQLSWWKRQLTDDLVEEQAHFEFFMAQHSALYNANRHTLKVLANTITPFVVALPPGRYQLLELEIRTPSLYSDANLQEVRFGDLAFEALPGKATYIGRIAVVSPRIIRASGGSTVSISILDVEDEDRAVLAGELAKVPVPFAKGLLGTPREE